MKHDNESNEGFSIDQDGNKVDAWLHEEAMDYTPSIEVQEMQVAHLRELGWDEAMIRATYPAFFAKSK